MGHKTIKEKLFALYDGELDPAARKEVEAHLSGCPECRELHGRWAKTAKVLFSSPAAKNSPQDESAGLLADEFFVKSVMSRIRERQAPKPAISRDIYLRWLVPAIGLALMLLAVLPPAPQVVSMDTWLFQDAGSRSSWLFSNNALSADETLQFVMEGSQ